jgi:hypothetical protein
MGQNSSESGMNLYLLFSKKRTQGDYYAPLFTEVRGSRIMRSW